MTVLFFLFLLFLAGPVGAGQYAPNKLCMTGPGLSGPYHEVDCDTMPLHHNDTPKDQPNVMLETQLPGGAICFTRMELAMQSVEEYLNTFLSNEQQKITGLVFTPHGLQEFERKMAIWNDVARDCWTK